MLAMASHAQQRTTVDIRSWQFSRDSVEWQSVRIPHDWAIAGPFDKKWDLQNVAIEQNGEKQKTDKEADCLSVLRRASLPPGGFICYVLYTKGAGISTLFMEAPRFFRFCSGFS